jgi:hypothetical protein
VKERPILFKGELVRAILDGRKTQTRRLVTAVAGLGPVREFQPSSTKGWDWIMRDRRALWNDLRHADLLTRCPHDAVGDRLWVRESGWKHTEMYEEDDESSLDRLVADFFRYAASPRKGKRRWRGDGEVEPITFLDESSPLEQAPQGRPCPSIHMPRWASRIDLEITEVRVQRLQEITEADARADGITELAGQAEPMRDLFAMLWDHINGKRASWASNPWVWALTFKRVRP